MRSLRVIHQDAEYLPIHRHVATSVATAATVCITKSRFEVVTSVRQLCDPKMIRSVRIVIALTKIFNSCTHRLRGWLYIQDIDVYSGHELANTLLDLDETGRSKKEYVIFVSTFDVRYPWSFLRGTQCSFSILIAMTWKNGSGRLWRRLSKPLLSGAKQGVC